MLFIAKPDALKERWTGRRITPDDASATSGVANIHFFGGFSINAATVDPVRQLSDSRIGFV